MADWMSTPAEGNFEHTVATVPDSIFQMELRDGGGAGGFAVIGSAKVGNRASTSPVMLRVPEPLRAELRNRTTGAEQTVILALVEYALNQLIRDGKTLVVKNKG